MGGKRFVGDGDMVGKVGALADDNDTHRNSQPRREGKITNGLAHKTIQEEVWENY